MKAPDKIYIQDYNIPEYGLSTTWTIEKVENDAVRSIKYIRKEALLEWLNNKLQEACDESSVPFEYYENGKNIGEISAFEQVIDKLNEM